MNIGTDTHGWFWVTKAVVFLLFVMWTIPDWVHLLKARPDVAPPVRRICFKIMGAVLTFVVLLSFFGRGGA